MNRILIISFCFFLLSCIKVEERVPLDESKVIITSEQFEWGYCTYGELDTDQFYNRDRKALGFRSYRKEDYDRNQDRFIDGRLYMEFDYKIREKSTITSVKFIPLLGDFILGSENYTWISIPNFENFVYIEESRRGGEYL